MIVYNLVKTLHILSAFLLLGTGLGSAFYKYMAYRSRDIRAIAVTDHHVVLADWIFTTPTIFIQPATGLWLAHQAGYPLSRGWIFQTLLLFILAGFCWLPVVWLQIHMRTLASMAWNAQTALPPRYHRMQKIWFWLGIPAFLAMLVIVFLMVYKPVSGV